jgi:3-hexulose-6-phosphate synthase
MMPSKPLFQVAFDSLDVKETLHLVELVQDYVDILEIGTALLKKEGVRIIERIKNLYPKKLVFADTKTVDLGKIEAQIVFEAGADMMSVCGIASDETIELAIHEAHALEKKVLIDLIGLGNSYRQVKRFSYLHPDYLAVHTGFDERNTNDNLFEKVEIISQISPIPLCISGGIRLDDIPYLLVFHPAIIAVDSAILNSSTPHKTAARFWKSLNTLSFLSDDYGEE